mgnify:CR=1 FL=1
MKKLLLIILLIVGCEETTETQPQECIGVSDGTAVEDIDGNCYATVRLGTQLWMAENLKTTHYNNGYEISNITNSDDWGSYDEGQYGVYDNDPANADIYGNLYNFAVVDDDRDVCPVGFHVPSDEEWIELEMFLGMSEEEANSTGYRGTNEGSQLAGNSDLWISVYPANNLVNNAAFGTSGFNALPTGMLSETSSYYNYGLGKYSSFWSSLEDSFMIGRAYGRAVYYNHINVSRNTADKIKGLSVRCVRD